MHLSFEEVLALLVTFFLRTPGLPLALHISTVNDAVVSAAAPKSPQEKPRVPYNRQSISSDLLLKLVTNWGMLRRLFRRYDPEGTGTVSRYRRVN